MAADIFITLVITILPILIALELRNTFFGKLTIETDKTPLYQTRWGYIQDSWRGLRWARVAIYKEFIIYRIPIWGWQKLDWDKITRIEFRKAVLGPGFSLNFSIWKDSILTAIYHTKDGTVSPIILQIWDSDAEKVKRILQSCVTKTVPSRQ